MKSIAVPFLIATATFSAGCSLPAGGEADCAWARPIRFGPATKDWLAERGPWPDPVRADLEKVARHNEKHETFCR
jgi:hypothetical protein